MTYEFERLTPERFGEFEQLRARVHPKGQPADINAFFGEHLPMPVIGYLARVGSDVAAYYGVFPTRVTGALGDHIVGQSGATMTAPEHQGKGLFTRLGSRCFDECREQGLAFVFGFPNANSYPGFVRRLGWRHRRTMISYWMPTVTPPIGLVGVGKRIQNRVANNIGDRGDWLNRPTALQTSVDLAVRGGVQRDEHYLRGKVDRCWQVSGDGFTAYVKVARHLDVGDLILNEPQVLETALTQLRSLARRVGTPFVRFHVSPGSPLDSALRDTLWSRGGLPYGHIGFRPDIDPDDFDFTLMDYDTF